MTLAKLLQDKGAHVQVYERDLNKYARQQGATLDLQVTGITLQQMHDLHAPGAIKNLPAVFTPPAD